MADLETDIGETLRDRFAKAKSFAERAEIINSIPCPTEPQLLDTCIVQNLDWIDRQLGLSDGYVEWEEGAEAELQRRFGKHLSDDLLDLGTLYNQFRCRSGYPWLVCTAALQEAGVITGQKGDSVRDMLDFIMGHQDDMMPGAFPGVNTSLPLELDSVRVSPLILRALGVTSAEDVYAEHGPLAFLPDRGDRLTTAAALFANIPIILTSDLKSFWSHRNRIESFGVKVMRPSELLDMYLPYWDLLDIESEMIRGESRR